MFVVNKPRPPNRVVQIEGNPVCNEILLNLPIPEGAIIFPQFTFVKLRTHDVIEESEQIIKYVYFINSGVASVLNEMTDGKSVEVGLTGKEGCTGLPLAVGLKTSASTIVYQIEGDAFSYLCAELSNDVEAVPEPGKTDATIQCCDCDVRRANSNLQSPA